MKTFDVKQFVKLGKKIVGAGLNYRSVVVERQLTIPQEPVIFLKPTSSYIVEGELIEIPDTFEVHHEIELGVIIGKKCKNVSSAAAKEHIGGYCLALDLTAVNLMKTARSSGRPWTLGKGFDTACPVSFPVDVSVVSNADDLPLSLYINDNLKQESRTSDMIFRIPELISFISKYMTLEPYDLVLTGSPAGTGPILPGDVLRGTLADISTLQFAVKR